MAIEKSALAKLRRATGYSFSKCKEALEKHSNDVPRAEEWLRAQAQEHGWEKATKLHGRATAQGLISVLASPTNAVMVETNCETDFVSRNKKFQDLVKKITQGCFHFSAEQQAHAGNAPLSSVPLSSDQLSNLPLAGSKPVKDETAISIGEVGENIQNRRAICLQAKAPVRLAGYTHPLMEGSANVKDVVQFGKYGAVVAYRPVGDDDAAASRNPSRLMEIGRQLCQHVVGMNPTEIGVLKNVSQVSEQPEESKPNAATEQAEDDHTIPSYQDSDEKTLLNQEFLLDPDLTVGEFLLENGIEVLNFVRYECGEVIESTQHG